MQRQLRLAACLAAGALWAFGPTAARAQDANRDVMVTKADVGDIVERLGSKTGDFREEFDDAVHHSMMDGTQLEDRAMHRADDLFGSARRLRDIFNDRRDKNNPAVRDEADRTLAAGADVNRIMKDHRFTDKLQRDWDVLKSSLNALASVYGLSPL
jgi:hypothetical protein